MVHKRVEVTEVSGITEGSKWNKFDKTRKRCEKMGQGLFIWLAEERRKILRNEGIRAEWSRWINPSELSNAVSVFKLIDQAEVLILTGE